MTWRCFPGQINRMPVKITQELIIIDLDLMGAGKNPEVGLLASMGEIKIRIAAKASDANEAEVIIRPVEEEIRSRLGEKIFGQDDESLEGVVNGILTGRNLTLSVLETFTAGHITQRLYGLPSARIKESLLICSSLHKPSSNPY